MPRSAVCPASSTSGALGHGGVQAVLGKRPPCGHLHQATAATERTGCHNEVASNTGGQLETQVARICLRGAVQEYDNQDKNNHGRS
eukprot:3543527-Amphidinium_carterae.1